MRLKIAGVLLAAHGRWLLAAIRRPPPPMAPCLSRLRLRRRRRVAPTSGTYRGMAESSSDGGSACRAPRGTQTARVSNNTITVAGLRGNIGPDGTITGRGLSGTVNGGTADLSVRRGRCTYHYT